MRKSTVMLSAILLVMSSGMAMAGGDAAAGKAKAAACAACHGANGKSTNPLYPNLAGQHEPYLAKSIKAYKAGDRGDPTMKAMVAPLSDGDIANLAAHYASQSCN
ncbi:MAG: c-type cytochrome [Pseudomonadota bacterium]